MPNEFTRRALLRYSALASAGVLAGPTADFNLLAAMADDGVPVAHGCSGTATSCRRR